MPAKRGRVNRQIQGVRARMRPDCPRREYGHRFLAAADRMAVDLTDIRTVRFDFDQQPAGALLIADIAFADAVDPQ
jgi:hypothetical protein